MDSHSPVAKILSALEQLLLRTEDWEIYANRENTLRVHREALIALIVEWRRLELSSWQTLLESEVSQCRRGGAKWWFQLYDAAIRGVLNAAAEEEQGQSNRLAVYLRELVSLLVEFMTSSSLGEFPHRLELLASFSAYSTSLMFARGGMQRRALERVHILLSSTHQYFNLFSEAISARLVSARVPLEKEIRDFIKLASWKDINVLALKQSAQRSHHQLYKIVRKFRDALKQPISGQIVPQFVSTPQRLLSPLITEGTSVSARLSPPEDLRSTVGYLARLQKTFVKFEDLVHRQIKPRVSSVPSERAEDVAIEILSSCQRLASLTVPATIEEKEKRVKFLKSVQSQKRKAWSDLLKELKIAGFSHHAKPELLDKNTDLLWISEQPPLPQSQSPVLVNKIEEYFCKLRGCLPALRAASTSHHDDINSRDLSKGVAVVEYLFHTTIELRAS
jgi:midasin